MHREPVEATPYRPNVIVGAHPSIRPVNEIPPDAQSADERQVRNIKMPRSSPLTIKVNDVSTGAYTLLTGGIIQFNTAPPNGHSLKWTGEFDVAARFDVDKINASMEQADFGSIRGIRVVEVLDAP